MTLRADLTPSAVWVVLAPGALTQVVLNLALNGLEAMAEGGGTLDIALGAGGGAVVLEVRDTGPGMPPEVFARCREPFFTTKPSDPGAGLGLPVVQGIAAGAGGVLEIDSAAGTGTTARVVLPAEPEPAP